MSSSITTTVINLPFTVPKPSHCAPHRWHSVSQRKEPMKSLGTVGEAAQGACAWRPVPCSDACFRALGPGSI